jgi:hypothetical protein
VVVLHTAPQKLDRMESLFKRVLSPKYEERPHFLLSFCNLNFQIVFTNIPGCGAELHDKSIKGANGVF